MVRAQAGECAALIAGRGNADGVSFAHQAAANALRDMRVIFNDEY